MKRINKFPEGFVWGTATAAYQIEGAISEGGKGESIWDRFSHIPGKILHGDTGDVACDCYHRTKEDVKLMAQMGAKAYRFSIAWSRIFPRGYGEVSEEGIAYYEELVDSLLEAGIEPYITLYHWDLPQKLQDEGGWANRKTAEHFADYGELILKRFGHKVHHWMTLNEPWVVSFVGHYTGDMAPGIRDFSTALQAAHTQLLGHGMVLKRFREMGLEGEMGLVLNLCPKEPLSDSPEDQMAAVRHDGYSNRWFLDPVFRGCYPTDMCEWYEKQGVILPEILPGDMELISAPVDFLGFNYYNIDYTKAQEGVWPLDFVTGFSNGNPMSHYQMPVTPWGLKKLLVRLWKDYQPEKLLITENGVSYQDYPDRNGKVLDNARIDYIHRHLIEAGKAIEEGVPLMGYFVWSLFDNFEWNTGYENQFGLIYVNRKTMERIPKKSYEWYKEIIETNGGKLYE